ncbi:hypothetical protein FRB94_008357 [Tulasnella sp. JGI-2019a]|nr:hypothetical protein FRB94_008357 [Tulasnella sp. JGI-2019a]
MATASHVSLDLNSEEASPSSNPDTLYFMDAQLAKLLDEKENELRLAGNLGQRILQQRLELEQRINALSEYGRRSGTTEPAGDHPTMAEKLQELQDIIRSWENENQATLMGFNGQKPHSGSLDSGKSTWTPSPSPIRLDLPPTPEPLDSTVASGISAAQSMRRAMNAAPRENTVKFAHDIGTSLLTEVRRLQDILNDRDKIIQKIKTERDDIDKENERLRTRLRQQDSSAEKFKEENWNLEVQIQDVRTQLQNSQNVAERTESELKQATKQLEATRELVDTHKSESEEVSAALKDLKTKHEMEVARMRKELTMLSRERGDLQVSFDNFKWDTAKRERYLKQRSGSRAATPITPTNIGGDEDPFAGATSSRRKLEGTPAFLLPAIPFDDDDDDNDDNDDDASDSSSSGSSPSMTTIVSNPNQPMNEVKTLQKALAHAHYQIAMLKAIIESQKLVGNGGNSILPDDSHNKEVEHPEKAPPRVDRSRGRWLKRPKSGRIFPRVSLKTRVAPTNTTLLLFKIIATIAGSSSTFFFLYLAKCNYIDNQSMDWM